MVSRLLGLSPLTRGNLGFCVDPSNVLGPIPAHAGEPAAYKSRRQGGGAYPRSRGGTGQLALTDNFKVGLSPLTRGNHDAGRYLCTPGGPIPAHAGEPARSAGLTTGTGAYPRSRGGTAEFRFDFDPCPGLSPLTRGNRMRWAERSFWQRPIPAHAGEPASNAG